MFIFKKTLNNHKKRNNMNPSPAVLRTFIEPNNQTRRPQQEPLNPGIALSLRRVNAFTRPLLNEISKKQNPTKRA